MNERHYRRGDKVWVLTVGATAWERGVVVGHHHEEDRVVVSRRGDPPRCGVWVKTSHVRPVSAIDLLGELT